jgi:hypothetical protein
MAVCLPGGLDKNSTGFAVSHAIRGILVIEYLRTGKHTPSTHTIVRPYSIGFSIAASIWLASAFVPAPVFFSAIHNVDSRLSNRCCHSNSIYIADIHRLCSEYLSPPRKVWHIYDYSFRHFHPSSRRRHF